MKNRGIARMLAKKQFYEEYRLHILKVLKKSKESNSQIFLSSLETALIQAGNNNDLEVVELLSSLAPILA